MTTITRERFRVELRSLAAPSAATPSPRPEYRTYTGTLSWDTENHALDLITSDGEILNLTGSTEGLEANEVRVLDVLYPDLVEGVTPVAAGALEALRVLGATEGHVRSSAEGRSSVVALSADLGAAAQENSRRTAAVTLFKASGKYYTVEAWRVPVNAIHPADMLLSPDFRRISDGAVLVNGEEPMEFPDAVSWGFPHLLGPETSAV